MNSGSGKTTVSLALTGALKNRGMNVCAFKCGPDYIDPMFYQEIIDTPCRNLDTFLCQDDTVRYLFAKNAMKSDIAVIEGVMGYYDGLAGTEITASTCDVSITINTPTILVVNPKGASLSVVAQIKGFCTFHKNTICGVIFNQVREGMYSFYKDIVESHLNLPVHGFLPYDADCMIESRHLGLLTAAEVANLTDKLARLGKLAQQHLDIDGLLACAAGVAPLSYTPLSKKQQFNGVRIAIAQDKCFNFYYADNLELLREMGAELVPFSPLQDPYMPDDIHGLYLGGGYPELHAEALAQNQGMREQIRQAVEGGMPTIAECGGFLYLQQMLEGQPMVGAIVGVAQKTNKLQNFGYVTLMAQKNNMLCRSGQSIRAHEFHYVSSGDNGDVFVASKPLRTKTWKCVYANETLYAGFPHLHFYADLEIPCAFLRACERHQRKGTVQ